MNFSWGLIQCNFHICVFQFISLLSNQTRLTDHVFIPLGLPIPKGFLLCVIQRVPVLILVPRDEAMRARPSLFTGGSEANVGRQTPNPLLCHKINCILNSKLLSLSVSYISGNIRQNQPPPFPSVTLSALNEFCMRHNLCSQIESCIFATDP